MSGTVAGVCNGSNDLPMKFLSKSPIGIAVLSQSLRYLAVNEALAKMNGVSIPQHLGRTIQEVLGDAAAIFEPVLERVLTTGQPVTNLNFTAKLPTREREGHWIETYVPISRNRVAAFVTEVTQQRRLEHCLADLNDKIPRIRDQVICLGLRDRSDAERKESWLGSIRLLEHCVQKVRDCSDLLPHDEQDSRFAALDELGKILSSATNEASLKSANGNERAPLSPRMVEVVRLLAAGKQNKEIAAAMSISVKTVETYRERLMYRLNLHSTADLVRYAISRNLINPTTP